MIKVEIAVSSNLFDSEFSKLMKNDWKRTQAAQMKFFRLVAE